MRNRIFSLLTFIFLLTAGCSGPEGFKKPEDALDAAREFVRAVLDGDYKRAELYVLPEEEDLRLFHRYKDYMKNQPEKERLGLKSSSILVNKAEPLNDSVTIINYANSFSKKPMDIRVVKKDGEWWIDFSFTFSGNEVIKPLE
ncbi:MAG: hypothetical protein ACRC2O_01555 [Chitinophagaceae bacterium]